MRRAALNRVCIDLPAMLVPATVHYSSMQARLASARAHARHRAAKQQQRALGCRDAANARWPLCLILVISQNDAWKAQNLAAMGSCPGAADASTPAATSLQHTADRLLLFPRRTNN